ncbi:hypothetical protein V6Z12_A02G024300, partial [Gossypium hirsutum]
LYKLTRIDRVKLRSRAVNTERTILSPFTKEYRVLAVLSGIRQFLEGSSISMSPNKSSSKIFSILTQYSDIITLCHLW